MIKSWFWACNIENNILLSLYHSNYIPGGKLWDFISIWLVQKTLRNIKNVEFIAFTTAFIYVY